VKKPSYRVPRMAHWLLNRATKSHDRFSVLGDYEEEFAAIAKDDGLIKAKLWYWRQSIHSLFPFVVNKLYWNLVMGYTHLKLTVRNLKKQKRYSLINLSGLTVGMACCLMILVYVFSELSYDRYHEHADRIYRMGTFFDVGTRSLRGAISNIPAGPIIVQDYPEVQNVVRIKRYMYRALVESEGQKFFEDRIFYADASLFDVFSFRLTRGDEKTALEAPYSIVITEAMALKYFGQEDPVGKMLKLDNRQTFTITGVMEDVPPNSHFMFDMLCSLETYLTNNPERRVEWMGDFNNYTYLLLQENTDIDALEQKFDELIDRHVGRVFETLGGKMEFFLQPLTRIHLYSRMEAEIEGNSDITYVYVFTAIALFILMIACINFMNLSTAKSATRAKEVGMKKVLGCRRYQLIKQFLAESMVYSFFAFALALILVKFSLPVFRSITGAAMNVGFSDIPWLLPGLVGLIFIVGCIAGSYPAFFLSAFRPICVLKRQSVPGISASRFRSTLVVFQFTISIVLIAGTGIIMNQVEYMKKKRLGFDKEHTVVLQIMDESILRARKSIKEELKRHPDVVSVAFASRVPGHGARHNAFLPEGYNLQESVMMGAISIDDDFLATLGMELVSGRNFSEEFSTDPGGAVLINETAVRTFGWENAVGRTIRELDGRGVNKRIIGVVRDFHVMSLRAEIEPLVIENDPDQFDCVAVRIDPNDVPSTMAFLEKTWKRIDPAGTFDYFFLDNTFDSQYRAEERLRTIFSYFTMFAIFIACLGLFGLASFTAEQRTKEIGIRKTLGARVSGIVLLLTKQFTRWILIANLFAWPIGWFAMDRWLQNFAYRTSVGLETFVLSTVLALAIALATVGFQTIKAARANPVDALRYE